MSPTVIMWAASLFGAALFFAAGFLLANRESTGASATDEVVTKDSGSDEALLAAQQEVSQLQDERQTFKGRVAELENKLEVKNGQIGELERQLFDSRRGLEDKGQAVDRLEAQLAELRTELDGEREKHQRADASPQAGEDFDDAATRIRDQSGDVDQLMDDSVPSDDSIAALMQALQAQVAEDPTWLSAALADDLGLPVVSAGEHSEALAVFSVFIKQLQQRTLTLLPLDTLRRFTLEDISGTVVSSCSLPDQSLSLVTLTRHATPSTAALTDMLESTSGRL